jgi:3-hydroxyisobutyrate dehydrogenase-like beta-hydroxyacid dehydrogenase
LASSPESAIEGSDVTILMLPDSKIIDQLLWGSQNQTGVAKQIKTG